jgi:hypothetical protein
MRAKVFLWILTRKEEFYADPAGLWQAFVKEMSITEEQAVQLRSGIQALEDIKKADALLQSQILDSKEFIASLQKEIQDKMNAMASVLTPMQLARFCIWVDENNWCMQMLNSLWSTTEPTVSDKRAL